MLLNNFFMFCTLLLTAYHRRGNTLVTVCYRLGTAYKGHSLTWKNVGTVGKKRLVCLSTLGDRSNTVFVWIIVPQFWTSRIERISRLNY